MSLLLWIAMAMGPEFRHEPIPDCFPCLAAADQAGDAFDAAAPAILEPGEGGSGGSQDE